MLTLTVVNRPFVHIVVIVLACVLVYWNTMSNGFHFDDDFRVVDNPGVQEFWPPWRHFADPGTCATLPRLVQYRPLLPLSLSVNYAIAGDSLAGYHIGNLLFQILASCAFYLLVSELFAHWTKASIPRHGALLVALMFAVHPVSGVLVNYICARDLLMMQMFLMGSLYCYVRMRRIGETRWRWASCLVLLLLSMLAKKNAAVVPALVLLFEVIPGGGSIKDSAVWRRVSAFAAVVFVVLAFAKFGLDFSDYGNVVTGEAGPYAAAQLQHHVFHYLRNFVWPFPIRLAAHDTIVLWQQIVGAVCIVGSFSLAWIWIRRRPLVAFGIFGYWVMLALTSSVLPFHSDIVPYRPYPSGAFLFLLVGAVVLRVPRIGTIGLGVAVVYFAFVSVWSNPTWKDAETHLRHAIQKGGSTMAFMSLADKLPNGVEKEEMYRGVLKRDPSYVEAALGLGLAEIANGKKDEGLKRVAATVAKVPNNAQVRYFAARGLVAAGQLNPAADEAAKASELDPGNFDYRLMAAGLAVEARRFQKSLEILKPLLLRRPDYKGVRFYAAIALHHLNQNAQARTLLEPYLVANPTHAVALYYDGLVKSALQDWNGAIGAFQLCLQAAPAYREAHRGLAACYAKLGNQKDANRHREIFRQGK